MTHLFLLLMLLTGLMLGNILTVMYYETKYPILSAPDWVKEQAGMTSPVGRIQ